MITRTGEKVRIRGATQAEGSSWAPARIFMAVSAVWHLPLGIVGLVVDQTFPVGAHGESRVRTHLWRLRDQWMALACGAGAGSDLASVCLATCTRS